MNLNVILFSIPILQALHGVSPGLKLEKQDGCHLWNRNFLPFRGFWTVWVHPIYRCLFFSLFILLSLFIWPLYCLSFHSRMLITPFGIFILLFEGRRVIFYRECTSVTSCKGCFHWDNILSPFLYSHLHLCINLVMVIKSLFLDPESQML